MALVVEYTPQNLEYAVSVFYNGQNVERANAHAWLTAAQQVPEAWKFVWELLQSNKGTEVKFFAATTLHTKILRCWSELPPESYNELKEKILETILAYANGPKIVTNRLCISLAAFILQQGIVDLSTILRPLSTPENTSLLLEVLTVIPEEYNSMTMGTALRSSNRTTLQRTCPAIINDMAQCMQGVYNDFTEAPSEELIKLWQACAACANSWLSLGGEDIHENNIPLSDHLPLCRTLLQIIRVLYTWHEAVSDTALDACEASLSALRSAGTGCDAARYPAAGLEIVDELAALAAAIMAKDNVPNSINEELLSAIITCVVAIGECHSTAIAKGMQESPPHQGAVQLVDVLLAAQTAPGFYLLHETRSNLTFGFWYTLQDEVQNMKCATQKMHPTWTDVFSRLLTGLVTKSEVPPENSLSRDELEQLRCYRQDIADTVMYCFAILGEQCWHTVEAAYARAAASEARREAALHTFAALSDSANHARSPASLLAMLAQAQRAVAAPDTPNTMLLTALDCLGSYASWLGSVHAREAGAPAAARECVIAAGAALPRAPAAAALALRRLCTACAPAAAPLAPRLVRAAQSPEGLGDTWVRRQLLGAAGAALAAAGPPAARPLLHELATTLEENLRAQVLDPTRLSGAAECVATLLTSLSPEPELLKYVFAIVLPTLPGFCQHPTLIEPMIHIITQTVTTLMENTLPMINEIAHLIIAAFNTQPCYRGHDLVKLIVLMVGEDWADAGNLLYVTVAATERYISGDPVGNNDCTQGLYLLLTGIAKKKPHYIDQLQDMMPKLIEIAIVCMCVYESNLARTTSHWLALMVTQRPALMHPYAPQLVHIALRSIGGCTPRLLVEPMTEVLMCVGRAAWPPGGGALPGWLRADLAPDDFPTPHAKPAHKTKFINTLLREKSRKRRVLDAVREFSLACRGLIDTEYARQSVASNQLVA